MLLGAAPLGSVALAAHDMGVSLAFALTVPVDLVADFRRVNAGDRIAIEDIDNPGVVVVGGNPAVSASPNFLVRVD